MAGVRQSHLRGAWSGTLIDPMDDEGFIHISPDPGLGSDVNCDFINANLAV
jgi:hypothetical protein